MTPPGAATAQDGSDAAMAAWREEGERRGVVPEGYYGYHKGDYANYPPRSQQPYYGYRGYDYHRSPHHDGGAQQQEAYYPQSHYAPGQSPSDPAGYMASPSPGPSRQYGGPPAASSRDRSNYGYDGTGKTPARPVAPSKTSEDKTKLTESGEKAPASSRVDDSKEPEREAHDSSRDVDIGRKYDSPDNHEMGRSPMARQSEVDDHRAPPSRQYYASSGPYERSDYGTYGDGSSPRHPTPVSSSHAGPPSSSSRRYHPSLPPPPPHSTSRYAPYYDYSRARQEHVMSSPRNSRYHEQRNPSSHPMTPARALNSPRRFGYNEEGGIEAVHSPIDTSVYYDSARRSLGPYTYVQKSISRNDKTVLRKKFSWKHYPEVSLPE